MTSQSLPTGSLEQWNQYKDDAAKIDKSIQETSTAYAEAITKLTDGKVGTLQERLVQYKIWLVEGKAALEALESGEYKEFCHAVEELYANSDDEEKGRNAALIKALVDKKAKINEDLSRVKSSIENVLEFCEDYEDA